MKKTKQADRERALLRQQAEARLSTRKSRILSEGGAVQARLIHDLEVHQIELEMQNDELKSSRYELEVERTRYADLFEFAPIGYFVLAGDGTIEEANHAAARMFGVSRQRLVGQRFSQHLDAPGRAAFDNLLREVITSDPEDRKNASADLALGGGRKERCDILATAVLRPGPRPTLLLAVKDVTARKRAEMVLRDESQRKDAFLAMLSHELRNPLTPIRNSLFLLARGALDAEQAKKPLAVIERQVGHLSRIVDDLLDVTRVARGKVRLQREPIDLGELVLHTTDDYRATFDTLGIELAPSVAPGPLWVDADPARMAQVIGNLLGNAAKFTSRGGRVDIALRREAQGVSLSVRDTGVGMSAETLASVFEAFVQGPQGLDRTTGGLGLGLAMVKGLMELHGGSVEAESPGVGRGAKFTLRLKTIDAPRGKAAAPPHSKQRATPQRVLVIEDNVDAADTLREVLLLRGHEVRVAFDGSTGLAEARDFRPEVVVCDIGLPQMNGYEVAHAIRQDAALRSAYLIALTGYASPEDFQSAADAGFDEHLVKPVDLKKLEELLDEPREASRPRAAGLH
jgi:PAS domain S-box-containing protein